MAKHIRIVLADDHFPVRAGTKALLEKEAAFLVVGEADNGQEAVDLVERMKPDILVCDLTMPQLTGQEVLRRVLPRSPRTRAIILSMHTDDVTVAEAMQAGASGYILKTSTGDELVRAIEAALHGERFLGSPFDEKGLDTYLTWDLAAEENELALLTMREREIMQLVAEGKTSAEIALILSIAARTVETHRANIMRKLNLTSISDLIRYAIRAGVLPLE